METPLLNSIGASGSGGGASDPFGGGMRRTSSHQRPRENMHFDMLDHFSLRSTLFRYQDKIVVNGVRHQLVFEMEDSQQKDRDGSKNVLLSVKRATVYGGWLTAIKLVYIYVVFFLVGVAVSFCVLVVMQYMIGVLLVGVRDNNEVEERLISALTILAVPSFISALSTILTFSVGFLTDCWNDFEYLNTLTLLSPLFRDWVVTLLLMLFPLGTFGISYLSDVDSPFNNMLLASLSASLFLFAICTVYTVLLEVYGCVKIIQACNSRASSLGKALYYLAKHRMKSVGVLKFWPSEHPEWRAVYQTHGVDQAALLEPELAQSLSWVAKIFYKPVRPKRLWTLKRVLMPQPILAKLDGAIMFLCCLTGVRFKGTLSRSHLHSSFACVALTSLLVWLVLLGYMTYSDYISFTLTAVVGILTFFIMLAYIWHMAKKMQGFKAMALQEMGQDRLSGEGTATGMEQAFTLETSASTNPFFEQGQDQSVASYLGNRNTNSSSDASETRFESDASTSSEGDEGHTNTRTPENLSMNVFNKMSAAKELVYVYAEPKLWTSVVLLALSFLFLFVVPFLCFLELNIDGYGSFFTFCYVSSSLRSFFNVHSLIEAYGPDAVETLELPLLDFIQANGSLEDGEQNEETGTVAEEGIQRAQDQEEELSENAQQHADARSHNATLGVLRSPARQLRSAKLSSGGRRVYLLLTRMANKQIRTIWWIVLVLASIAMLMLIVISVNIDTSHSSYAGAKFYGNSTNLTHYVPKMNPHVSGFPYPACTLFDDLFDEVRSNSDDPSKEKFIWTTTDFVYVSDLAYSTVNNTQEKLDEWFPPGFVEYIPSSDYPKVARPKRSSAVFKLFKIHKRDASQKDVLLLSIRGTINTYDLLADMQVWIAATLMQFLRFLLPFGTIWDGILPTMIQLMSFLETNPANEISYENDVAGFVGELMKKNPNSRVALTGHSLGGGLAMIVGARQHVPAVAISGPNSLLSRVKFGISREAIDSFTINIIPRGDPVPLVDEQALLTESIHCRSSKNDSPGECHQVVRSLCELQFVCGSGSRPPLQICGLKYNYPDPQPVLEI